MIKLLFILVKIITKVIRIIFLYLHLQSPQGKQTAGDDKNGRGRETGMRSEVYAARILRYTDPDLYEQFIRKASPMLNSKHVGKVKLIYSNTISLFSNTESNQTVNDIFIGATYSIFCPVSFIPSYKQDGKDAIAAGKLPAGVRDMMAECIGLKHPEEVNRYKRYIESFLRPFYTGPKRPFEVKVDAVVDTIRPYSINQWDHQFNLFG